MKKSKFPQENNTTYWLKIPIEILRIIEITDPVYTFCEIMDSSDCENCTQKENCHKSNGNRIIRLNEELTGFHKEVLENLNCVHGAMLRINRSIQAEGAFGGIKWNRAYTRARKRGLNGLNSEILMISCDTNPCSLLVDPAMFECLQFTFII